MAPQQKPGKSVQSVGTPKAFLDAVRHLLRIREFAIDLAADTENYVCEPFFTADTQRVLEDSTWHSFCGGRKGWAWLNPEFNNIYPWAEKCWQESRRGAQIAMLVPAATDTRWWAECVRGKGYVLFIRGRFAFVGHTASYPKGLALVLYAPYLEGGDRMWAWAQEGKGTR